MKKAIMPIAVFGLGNVLMGDDGVGIHVVRELRERQLPEWAGEVEFIEAGTAMMRILHMVAGRDKVVFVDCSDMNCRPGTVKRFEPEDVKSLKIMAGFSVHEGDLMRMLELSGQLGERPRKVVIFGIQPLTVAPGDRLSEPLKQRVVPCADLIAGEIAAGD